MSLDNDDLLVVQKASGGELRKTSVQNLLAQGDALWQENATTLYPKTTTVRLGIGGTLPGTPNIVLNPDGSASFEGKVDIGGTQASPNITLYESGQADFGSNLFLNANGERSGGQSVVAVYDNQGKGVNTAVVTLNADGSAEFAGSVSVTRALDTNPCINVFKTGVTNPTAKILADGSASFAGDVTFTTDANTVDAGTNAYIWSLGGGDSNGHHLELSKKTKAGSESRILRVDRSSGDLNIDNNVLIGGTLPSAPNISLNADGSIQALEGAFTGDTIVPLRVGDTTRDKDHGIRFAKNHAGLAIYADIYLTNDGLTFGTGTSTDSIRNANELVQIKDGNVSIGGTLPSAPNISLNASGSGEFGGTINYQSVPAVRVMSDERSGNIYGEVTVYGDRGIISDNTAPAYRARVRSADNSVWEDKFAVTWDGSATFAGGILLGTAGVYPFSNIQKGYISLYPSDDSTFALSISRNGTSNSDKTFWVLGDGSASFAGDIGIGGTLPSAPNIKLNADGSASFAGRVESLTDFLAATDGNGGLIFEAENDSSKDVISRIKRDNTGLHIINDSGGALGGANQKIDFAMGSDTPDITFKTNGDAEFKGSVLVGGTLPSAPNIKLNADGTSAFSGVGVFGTLTYNTGHALVAQNNGSDVQSTFVAVNTNGSVAPAIQVRDGDAVTDTKATIFNNGSASFAGKVEVLDGQLKVNRNTSAPTASNIVNQQGGNTTGLWFTNGSIHLGGSDVPSSPLIKLDATDGSATFAGDITANNVTFDAGTADAINVRERLVAARETFQELQSAVANATDFAELKAAMLTALADYANNN